MLFRLLGRLNKSLAGFHCLKNSLMEVFVNGLQFIYLFLNSWLFVFVELLIGKSNGLMFLFEFPIYINLHLLLIRCFVSFQNGFLAIFSRFLRNFLYLFEPILSLNQFLSTILLTFLKKIALITKLSTLRRLFSDLFFLLSVISSDLFLHALFFRSK